MDPPEPFADVVPIPQLPDQKGGLGCDSSQVKPARTRRPCQGQLATVSSLQTKQHTEPLAHISNDVGWGLRFERESPRLPIEILDVIGKDDP